jgi:Domain of unknown function (DUF4200)
VVLQLLLRWLTQQTSLGLIETDRSFVTVNKIALCVLCCYFSAMARSDSFARAGTQAMQNAMQGQFPQGLTLDHVSPATRLLEKRRQMFEVQEALDAQKDEFSRREDALKRREDALRRKDLELQESLIKFNKFLQENESKRNRAIKRAADERKQREQKEAEIAKLRAQYSDRFDEEAKLKEDLEKHRRYQDYLYRVS